MLTFGYILILGGLFSQPTQVPTQSNQLINTASALSAPTLLGDERDAILAKWNQLQAFWGTGKGFFNHTIPPVEFTQENPFCRFKVSINTVFDLHLNIRENMIFGLK